MSGVYIQGIIDNNIRNDSPPYVPIVEAITNSIDSIEKIKGRNGKIDIYLIREKIALPLDDSIQDIISIKIVDNGIGFTQDNRKSFDTLYSPQKKDMGGKGFGRFFYLKHFSEVHISSTYRDESGHFKTRSFDFGRQFDVFLNERDELASNQESGTELSLRNLQLGTYDKDPEIFAHRLLEKLLSYFVDETYNCPTITIYDDELKKPLVLNKLIGVSKDSLIQLKKEGNLNIAGEEFKYKMFKILRPRNQKSRIFLTARNQSVSDTALETYIPEFATDFFEKTTKEGEDTERNYIVRFYVHGAYLDTNVTVQRDKFNFGIDKDGLYPVSQKEIEQEIASIARDEFSDIVNVRFNKKKERIHAYATQNVWYRPYLEDIDYAKVKANLSENDLEALLHEAKFKKDLEIKNRIHKVTSGKSYKEAHENAEQLVKEAKQSSVSDLAQYVAFRKSILELFKKTIKLTEEGSYEDEQAVHDLIFPTKTNSKDTDYDGHNLWILDERLTFTQFISSDQGIYRGKNRDRPDIAAFYYEVAYRETNESHSPISIFEFKKPGRHDFVNPSSTENPFEQIKRYVLAIKNGDLKTFDGVEIQVGENTPFYGYIVADVDKKIRNWLKMENFKPLPDGQGWFYRHEEMNLYIEYMTWQKLIRDAEIRHRKFFELLKIEG